MNLYWLTEALSGLPWAFYVYVVMGVPWALVLLPRADWQRRTLVATVAFAVGPALLTAWMLIPGWIGGYSQTALLRFPLVLAGTILLTLSGTALAWWKWRTTDAPPPLASAPLVFDERLLLGLIGAALTLRWFITAYWTFTAYDALWVYGYEGRLYTLRGYIPDDIGYYPQFLPLQFTFIQLAVGNISDHAARMVIPFLHIGSILAAFTLGRMLFTRRAGFFLAAIWAFYPHVSEWAHIGDLEIPLTFLLTATSAFLLAAWFAEDHSVRRRYSLIAGLLFGIAMWTKPTAGAFVWGVVLLVLVAFFAARLNWRRWLPSLEIAVIMGAACIPLGGIWYLRNWLLGLPVLVFPHASWLSRATRSGDLFGWVMLALFTAAAYIAVTRRFAGRGWLIIIGVGLIVAGTFPSSPLFNPARRDPPASYLSAGEIALIIGGVTLIASQLWREINTQNRRHLMLIGYSGLLALPYFLTWFWSYSYHARLSFAIVPLLILPTAALLAAYLPGTRIQGWNRTKQALWTSAILLLTIPSMLLPLFSIDDRYHDWLWQDRYPDDLARYKVHNPDVTLVAEQLFGWQAEHAQEPVIIAPGEQRLRFFLPDATIISDTVPTSYEELNGATHYIYGTLARWRYEDEAILPLQNRIVSSLARSEIMTQRLRFTDGTFRYELYELHPEQRVTDPENSGVYIYPDTEVIFGGFVRLHGSNVGNTQLTGNRIFFDYLWEVLAVPDKDYTLRISLLNLDDGQIYHEWEAPVSPGEHGYYSTLLWEPGEFIIDSRSIIAPTDIGIPRGQNYRLVLNLVEMGTTDAVPVMVNGEPEPAGFALPNVFVWGN